MQPSHMQPSTRLSDSNDGEGVIRSSDCELCKAVDLNDSINEPETSMSQEAENADLSQTARDNVNHSYAKSSSGHVR